MCGKDRKWHAAEAVISGDTVVVTSKGVPEPVGVQYAYNATPIGSNLYNKAGLPATPFAVIDGKLMFEEDDQEKVAALKAKYAARTDPDHPVFEVAGLYRDGAIIQRDQPIPLWGFAKALNRPGIPQGFVSMSSGNGKEMASPLSWTSFAGIKDMKNPAFRARLDALLLQDPNSEVSRKAIAAFLKAVKTEVAKVADMAGRESNMSGAPLQYPAFPEPGRGGEVKPDTVPTFAYNWCVSPFTPMGVAGVIWLPSQANLGYVPAEYSSELEIHARSLPATYGMESVLFLHAQPSATLVPGIIPPKIENSKAAEFTEWPKSVKDIAIRLGAAATQ